MAGINSCVAALEAVLFSRLWARQPLNEEPVFILGHPRTGTTHLHNLLALDGRFAYATILQAGFPSSFLCCELFKGLLAPILDSTRPMDNMAISFDTPAEDELATNVLTGGISPYMPITLMKSHKDFAKYYTFQDASPAELKAWMDSFLGFLRKVTYRHGGTKPLLIKSPVHTARVRLLLRLFPKAKFIYIHRHPLQVFQSAAHMADTYYWYCYLQRPSDQDITSFILDQYDCLYRTYLKDRELIPPGNLVEVSFAELDHDPLGTLRSIYHRFGWGNFEEVLPRLKGYCASLSDFKKNDHSRLPPEVEDMVRVRWADSFKTFGYR
ncbi:hypothetical protein N2152v2_008277 [Parachlorella kessleri]